MVSKVKEYREKIPLPQQELARVAGVSRQTIYYLEKGTYNPKLTLSFKLAEILKVTIEELFVFEPVIKDVIDDARGAEIETIIKELGITYEKFTSLKSLDEVRLLEEFNVDELKIIAYLRKVFELSDSEHRAILRSLDRQLEEIVHRNVRQNIRYELKETMDRLSEIVDNIRVQK